MVRMIITELMIVTTMMAGEYENKDVRMMMMAHQHHCNNIIMAITDRFTHELTRLCASTYNLPLIPPSYVLT